MRHLIAHILAVFLACLCASCVTATSEGYRVVSRGDGFEMTYIKTSYRVPPGGDVEKNIKGLELETANGASTMRLRTNSDADGITVSDSAYVTMRGMVLELAKMAATGGLVP